MVVQSYTEGTRYGERERDLLMFVSTQVAMAIERKRVQNALTNSETRQRAILNAIPDLMLLLNSKGEVIDYFTSSEDFLSLSPESFVGKAIEKIYPAAVAKKITSLIKKTLQTGQVQLHEYGIQLSGEEKSFEARISACGPDTAVTIIRDITEDRKNDEALRQLNEKLTRKVNELEQHNREALLLNKMGDMLQSCLASEEAYVVVQQYGEQIFPDHSGALFMLNPSKNVLEAVAEWGEDLGSQTVFVPENCWGLRRGRTHTVINPGTGLLCRHVQAAPSNGDKQPYYCVPMSAQGETMGMLYLHGGSIETAQRWETLAVMVTEQIALALANLNLRDILQNQSIRDPLMNLFNRRYLQETMEREISRALRYSMPLGVIMADIDNFKRFNDTMGHDAGDTALKELGSLLVANTRKEDIACRYGGDEIAIILPGASLESTRERAEQIREAVKQLYIKYEDQPMVRLSMSFGVAACPEHGTTVKELLQAADTALYVSKDAGRDRVSCAAAPDGR
jgi:diguanylate cyclase (GGDEF)-like protein/PAS domain S-box-containing protein